MTSSGPVGSESRWIDIGAFTAGCSALIAIVAGSCIAENAGEALTRNTVRLSLVWYAVSLCLLMRLRGDAWLAATRLGRLARWCWTWAAAIYLVHVAMAFHYYHHWSHAAAFEHVRETGGLGQGIYFSYLFTVLWTADVLWWWLLPQRYAARSPWIDRTLHGFMLFMVFNGAVVFATGPMRWAGVAMFVAFTAMWLFSRSSLNTSPQGDTW